MPGLAYLVGAEAGAAARRRTKKFWLKGKREGMYITRGKIVGGRLLIVVLM